jgi:NAD(P)-dependent dehydrogenase (short-subunit alcohol dehydrogenase family)
MSFGKYAGAFRLDGKVVFVAGGVGGIGAEIARAAASQGARIVIADRLAEQTVQAAAQLEAEGAQAVGVTIDVRTPASVAAGIAAAEEKLGPLDVMVNCVGTHIEEAAEDVTLEAWNTVVGLNLTGAFILSQAAARSLIAHEKGGSIMHITSVRSALGIHRGYAAYCASKGGLAILIKQLATEWAKYNIRVNGIAPTFTRTPLVDKYLNDPVFYGDLVKRIPLGRVCEPTDLGGIAVFLAADASAFITGQNIFVDGGVTACQ